MEHTPSPNVDDSLPKDILPRLQAAGGPRSLIVTVAVMFFALTTFLSISHYQQNPWLFGSLAFVGVVLVGLVVAVGLGVLGKPVQAEPGPLSFFTIQKLGMYFASGLSSPQALAETVRLLSGTQPLPIPAGVVDGDAANEKNWREIPAAEARELAEEDNAAVDRRVQEIALQLAETAMKATLTWAPLKEIKGQQQLPSKERSTESERD